ncbi:MAG: HEAT repeat domain-containing protein [Candidatus Binatia bacterium]
MLKTIRYSVMALLLGATTAAAASPPARKTLFHEAEKAWAVGTVAFGTPLSFREGKVLVFPSIFSDLLWAPEGAKPRNLMVVYEVPHDEREAPALKRNEHVFAPIRLLPENSYWRDNLPNTRRHELAGGKRFAFRGDEIPEVRKHLGAYLAAMDIKGLERWKGQLRAVAASLGSKVTVLREEAAAYIAGYPALARDFGEEALPDVAAYLGGDAPPAEKGSVVDALAAAKVVGLAPVLSSLAEKDDATGAAALQGLETLGQGPTTDRLMTLSASGSPEMRGYAAAALGRRAAADDKAFGIAKALLESGSETPEVRTAVVRGLGEAGGEKVVALLGEEVGRGDSMSRSAGEALATIGGPASFAVLSRIVVEKKGEAALAAAAGLGQMRACPECAGFLHEQHEKHPDETVRNLISVVLELPAEHKH